MKIYISGKISGLTEAEYTDNFAMAERSMVFNYQCNYSNSVFICPIYIKPILGVKKWMCYMIADIWQLRKCSHIAMQKNWTDSKGAVVEYFFAKWVFKQQIIWL